MEVLLSAILTVLSDAFFYLRSKNKQKGKLEKKLEERLKKILDEVAGTVISKHPFSVEDQASLKDLAFSFDATLSEQFFTLLSRETSPVPIPDGDSNSSAYSNAAIRDLLVLFGKQKGVEGICEDVVSRVVPEIITQCIQKMSLEPELAEYVTGIQNGNILASLNLYHMEVLSNLSDLKEGQKKILAGMETFRRLLRDFEHGEEDTNKTISNVMQFYYQSQYRYASSLYIDKLFAGVHSNEMRSHFRFFPPGLYKVRPSDFGEIAGQVSIHQENKLSLDKFLDAIETEKRLFLVAGAGVGKTTFLLHLHRLLLEKFSGQCTLPIFANVKELFGASSNVSTYIASYLEFYPSSIDRKDVENVFIDCGYQGWLLLLLDSLDQTDDLVQLKSFLKKHGNSTRVVIACREEKYLGIRDRYKKIFQDFKWIYLDRFSLDELLDYLRPELLPENFRKLSEDVQSLLRTRFYAAAVKKILQQPGAQLSLLTSRAKLMSSFFDYMFQEADQNRDITFRAKDLADIESFLGILSLDTLCDEKIQDFPYSFLDKYKGKYDHEIELLFNADWVYFRHCLFDSIDGSLQERRQHQCSFFHQLLQEYFAARRLKQYLETDPNAFNDALTKLPYSVVILDLLDELLPDEKCFKHCMNKIEESLEKANAQNAGLSDTGHKFTWLLALRDRKGEKPGLREVLQIEFDKEMEKSKNESGGDENFAKIPAGVFIMGSYEFDWEQPVRVVYLSEYEIARCAVTFDEYSKEISENNRDLPVVDVSWNEANKYALNTGFTLPTEAQWEKAARGTLGRRYPWGNEPPDREKCNFNRNERKTVAVKSYKPCMYGIYQMAGNVWEWCRDEYKSDAYDESSPTDPIVEPEKSSSNRVNRGGSWRYYADNCRAAGRDWYDPGNRNGLLGLRLARTNDI